MSERPEGTKFQANFKTKSGTLLNIYASDAIDFDNALNILAEYGAVIASVEQSLHAIGTIAEAMPLAPVAAQTPAVHVSQVPAATPVGSPFGNSFQSAPNADVVCGHNEPAKFIGAGVSKKTGKPYKAFYACAYPQAQACDFRQTA
jgi:hypothetical protein